MRAMITALTLVGLSTSAAAVPPPAPACLTRAQVSDVTLFALPIMLDAATAKCRPSLPANAYLLNGGHALSERLAVNSAQHWQGAVTAMQAFGDKKMPEGISADTARSLVRDVMTSEMLKTTTPTDCRRINEMAELLAPLPPENIARLMSLGLEMAGDGKKGGPPPICP